MSAEQLRKLINEMDSIEQANEMFYTTSDDELAQNLKNVKRTLVGQDSGMDVRFSIDIPNHASNNNPRRVHADFVDYDSKNNVLHLQVGNPEQKKWKFIYKLAYNMDDARVFANSGYYNVVFTMDTAKPLDYSKEPNPNVKINNPKGKAPIGPRPDPYAS